MQYLENGAVALRAAYYVLAPREGLQLKFHSFPMIHIGSADFYAQVRSKLRICDQILFEGVRSMRVRVLTLSYGLLARRKRLGLVLQSVALPLRQIGPQLIPADVTSEEFAEGWGNIPWYARLAITVGAPLFGVYQYLTATKESIGKQMSVEDVKSREELQFRESQPGLHAAALDRRDARLTNVLETVISGINGPCNVGVLYGAGHMSSVTDCLMGKHGFRVVHSEWLTVFDYTDT